jgi:acetyltransferase-like isoleucine patch superfamily enzyme
MVKILTSVHREEEDLSKPIVFCDLEFGEVNIKDGCDIGIGSIVLPGVKIGEGSIVGAGSVVTKDIPPYSVGVGNPVRVIRRRNLNR